MIHPTVDQLAHGELNRYEVVLGVAKCARIVTDEYVEQREIAEKMLANKETDKSLASMIKREIRDEKAVKTAIKRLYNGDFVICEGKEEPAEDALEQTKEAVEAAAEAAVSVFDDEEEEEEIEETEEA